jgi:hypothetical protein
MAYFSQGVTTMTELCHSMPICKDVAPSRSEAPILQFKLQIRADQITALRLAAAKRFAGDNEEELEEILGPIADPSIQDCLMAMLLPPQIDGCTMLSVDIEELEKAA